MRTATLLLYLCIFSLTWAVTQTLAFKCDVTATNLNFGNYDTMAPAPCDSTASINVACNMPPQHPNSPLTVTISISPGSSGSFAQRQMQSTSTDNLNYNLYSNASFSTIWGDGGGSSSTQVGFVTSTTPWDATLYGRIPALQNIRAGSYSDTITVTIDF